MYFEKVAHTGRELEIQGKQCRLEGAKPLGATAPHGRCSGKAPDKQTARTTKVTQDWYTAI